MSDSQARDPVNKTCVPKSEASEKKWSRPDIAITSAALGLFGAIVGAMVTWGVNLGVVWQATGAFIGALLIGGFNLLYLPVVMGAKCGPNGDATVLKRSLRATALLASFSAVVGALAGALMGVVLPHGGLLVSLKYAAIMAAVGGGLTLFGFVTFGPLWLLLFKVVPRPARAAVIGALIGSILGSQLWRAWFQVGWFNFGIPVVGIPMAFAFFIGDRQTGKGSESSEPIVGSDGE